MIDQFFTIGMASTFAEQQTTNSLFDEEPFETPATSASATSFNTTHVESGVATSSEAAKFLSLFGQTPTFTGYFKTLFI